MNYGTLKKNHTNNFYIVICFITLLTDLTILSWTFLKNRGQGMDADKKE